MSSFRDRFLAAAPPAACEVVETDAGPVHVTAMLAGEKDLFDRAHHKARGRAFRARLVVATARDEKGRHLFAPGDLDDLDGLPLSYLEPLVEAAIRVNGMQDDAREALEKN